MMTKLRNKENFIDLLVNIISNMNESFIFEIDAYLIEICVVLKQGGKSIAYISRVLKVAKTIYTAMKRETLSAEWAIKSRNFI